MTVKQYAKAELTTVSVAVAASAWWTRRPAVFLVKCYSLWSWLHQMNFLWKAERSLNNKPFNSANVQNFRQTKLQNAVHWCRTKQDHWLCCDTSTKLVMGAKMHWNKLQGSLIFKIFLGGNPFPFAERRCSSPAPYPTRLPLLQQDSALATVRFPLASFFFIWKPCIMV